jgi:hypothetical protein
MRQCISPKPFSEILAEPVAEIPAEWPGSSLKQGEPIANPAARRAGPAVVSSAAVRTLEALMQGLINVRYVAGPDPVLTANFLSGEDQVDRMSYRTRSDQLYSTTKNAQPAEEAALLATFLLLNRAPHFGKAYLALLKATNSMTWSPTKINRLTATAADELVYACSTDLGLDAQPCNTIWFYNVHVDLDRISEFDEPGEFWLDGLLQDPGILRDYLAGKPTALDGIKVPRLPK